MRITLILILFSALFISLKAQYFSVSGEVTDVETNAPLSFANIRVMNSNLGTAANSEGQFELKLKPGNYFLISSYIGYNSDTLLIILNEDLTSIIFSLKH